MNQKVEAILWRWGSGALGLGAALQEAFDAGLKEGEAKLMRVGLKVERITSELEMLEADIDRELTAQQPELPFKGAE